MENQVNENPAIEEAKKNEHHAAIEEVQSKINSLESLHVHKGDTTVNSTAFIDIKGKLEEIAEILGESSHYINLNSQVIDDTIHLYLVAYVAALDVEFQIPVIIASLEDTQSQQDCAQSLQAYIANESQGVPYLALNNGMAIAISEGTIQAFAEGLDKRFGIENVTVENKDGIVTIASGDEVNELRVSEVSLTDEIIKQLKEEFETLPLNKEIARFLARGVEQTMLLMPDDLFEKFKDNLLDNGLLAVNDNLIVKQTMDKVIDTFIQWRDNENGSHIIEIKTSVWSKKPVTDILIKCLPDELR